MSASRICGVQWHAAACSQHCHGAAAAIMCSQQRVISTMLYCTACLRSLLQELDLQLLQKHAADIDCQYLSQTCHHGLQEKHAATNAKWAAVAIVPATLVCAVLYCLLTLGFALPACRSSTHNCCRSMLLTLTARTPPWAAAAMQSTLKHCACCVVLLACSHLIRSC